jgi:hypothetical protein
MDLPLKVEIPQLSHTDLLKIVLPIAPGAILFLDSVVAGFRPIQYLDSFSLGYKTALAICLFAIYFGGLACIQLVQTLSILLATKLKPAKNLTVYKDPYWRRLVTEYLGEVSNPDTLELADSVAVDHYKNVIDFNSESREAWHKSELQSEKLRKAFDETEAKVAQMPETPEKDEKKAALAKISVAKADLDLNKKKLITNAVKQFAWLQLSATMPLLQLEENPYEGYDELMLALQTAAVIQFLFALFCHAERLLAVLVLSSAMIVVASYGRWQVFTLGRTFGELNAVPIAAILKKLKARDEPK